MVCIRSVFTEDKFDAYNRLWAVVDSQPDPDRKKKMAEAFD